MNKIKTTQFDASDYLTLTESMRKSTSGERQSPQSAATELVFITEEMEADGTAQKIRENMSELVFINRIKKE